MIVRLTTLLSWKPNNHLTLRYFLILILHCWSGKEAEVVKKGTGQVTSKPRLDIRLTDLKLVLGPELRIVYPLILDFVVSGELELNGIAHPKLLKPKGVLMFENGDVNLVATQVRLQSSSLFTLCFKLVSSRWQIWPICSWMIEFGLYFIFRGSYRKNIV